MATGECGRPAGRIRRDPDWQSRGGHRGWTQVAAGDRSKCVAPSGPEAIHDHHRDSRPRSLARLRHRGVWTDRHPGQQRRRRRRTGVGGTRPSRRQRLGPHARGQSARRRQRLRGCRRAHEDAPRGQDRQHRLDRRAPGYCPEPPYNVSQAGVLSWTQGHAEELAPFNINVNAICPGSLWTPLFERLINRSVRLGLLPPLAPGETAEDSFRKRVEGRTPLKRPQTPEDVGKVTAFLVSDDARNITGQAINLDGGARMN
ncbi:MAG: SDR family NAD(P)-dependent oxidoreductase [Dehalococcoidia bacterium]